MGHGSNNVRISTRKAQHIVEHDDDQYKISLHHPLTRISPELVVGYVVLEEHIEQNIFHVNKK